MAQAENKETKTSTPKWLKATLIISFIIAAILLAYLTFIVVQDLITTWEITNLPGVTVKDPTPTPDQPGAAVISDTSAPLQPVDGPAPPAWDGASRVTVLIMGLDYRDWAAGEGPPRTDTMILFTVDPLSQTAGMLSIPRDLWVNIPGGFDYGRINTAYQLGEAYTLPGGGPGLATDTVEELLGVPIDYYAQIDFGAFIRFIDEIQGIKINIPEKIKVDPIVGKPKWLKPGVQVLPGDLALAYVRVRKTEGGDFDRSQRQQDVILAIRNRILDAEMLPTLIQKAPILYNELSAGVHTNLSLDQAIRLAWLAAQIPQESIKSGVIGSEHINFASSPDGTQEVLKPLTEKIRLLRDEIFTANGPASPVAANMNPVDLMKAEGARVAVLNASYTPGLAASTTEYLLSLGVNVTQTDNSEKLSTYTEITSHSGKPYTVKFLVDLMQINPLRIRHFFDPTSPVDIVITLGDDWANNNPMP